MARTKNATKLDKQQTIKDPGTVHFPDLEKAGFLRELLIQQRLKASQTLRNTDYCIDEHDFNKLQTIFNTGAVGSFQITLINDSEEELVYVGIDGKKGIIELPEKFQNRVFVATEENRKRLLPTRKGNICNHVGSDNNRAISAERKLKLDQLCEEIVSPLATKFKAFGKKMKQFEELDLPISDKYKILRKIMKEQEYFMGVKGPWLEGSDANYHNCEWGAYSGTRVDNVTYERFYQFNVELPEELNIRPGDFRMNNEEIVLRLEEMFGDVEIVQDLLNITNEELAENATNKDITVIVLPVNGQDNGLKVSIMIDEELLPDSKIIQVSKNPQLDIDFYRCVSGYGYIEQ